MIEQQGILDIIRADFMYNEQDFIALMRQDQDRIYRLAFHLLGSEEEAKDATQEVFVKAWKKLKSP